MSCIICWSARRTVTPGNPRLPQRSEKCGPLVSVAAWLILNERTSARRKNIFVLHRRKNIKRNNHGIQSPWPSRRIGVVWSTWLLFVKNTGVSQQIRVLRLRSSFVFDPIGNHPLSIEYVIQLILYNLPTRICNPCTNLVPKWHLLPQAALKPKGQEAVVVACGGKRTRVKVCA